MGGSQGFGDRGVNGEDVEETEEVRCERTKPRGRSPWRGKTEDSLKEGIEIRKQCATINAYIERLAIERGGNLPQSSMEGRKDRSLRI